MNQYSDNNCTSCGEQIKDNDALWLDSEDKPYCEDCWIEHEAIVRKTI